MPQSTWQDVRVGGALNGMVFVVGTAGSLPFLWAVNAGSGSRLWQQTGVEFAALALPADGSQILTAGAQGADASGSYMVLDAAGEQVWTHPLKTSVDYGRVSLSKAAFAGDHYVLLLAEAQKGERRAQQRRTSERRAATLWSAAPSPAVSRPGPRPCRSRPATRARSR